MGSIQAYKNIAFKSDHLPFSRMGQVLGLFKNSLRVLRHPKDFVHQFQLKVKNYLISQCNKHTTVILNHN